MNARGDAVLAEIASIMENIPLKNTFTHREIGWIFFYGLQTTMHILLTPPADILLFSFLETA